MRGITADLYVGATPFPGWDNLTYVKKVNLSACSSTYTRSQVDSALGSYSYLWDRTVFKNAVATILDTYVPDWQLSYMPSYPAPNFSGDAKFSPDHYLQLFPGANDFAPMVVASTGAWYLKFNDTFYTYALIQNSGECSGLITTKNTTNNYSMSWGLAVYGQNVTKNGTWTGVSPNGAWQIAGGIIVKCSDGVGILQFSTYDANGTCRVRFDRSSTSVNCATAIYNAMSDGWTPLPDDTDPFVNGGYSGVGGGTGTFDGTGDNVSIPSLPTLSAVDTGFITLFNPTIAQLKALASFMWSNPLFDVSAWKKIFADPMNAILGLSLVPVVVPSGGTANVKVGNISTDVGMTLATAQFVEVDCGTLNVMEYWGAYLDYDPYTKAEIYLPYIGFRPLATDDIMGKSVTVKYHVDILSGACVAYVKCGNTVLYSFIGQCASSIPITGNDWTNVINGVMSIAGAIGTTVATGGATAPMSITSVSQTVTNQLKPTIQRSGGMSGTGGMLAVQTPYITLTRPNQALPKYQNKYLGYPAFITMDLSEIEGYTEIESIHLENVPATAGELSELETILKTGVIF